ncbi:hypothetical protein ACFVMC_12765 [Nocardia sp. NPDC127579]|uniref:hypothetical protein n=1 Tax=Nocardia sp. NPDC127579 TaxID=3345402 RepID=UPI00363894A3
MRFLRPALTFAASGSLLAGITTAWAAPASAAPPQAVCGIDYKTVSSMRIGSSGTVYLTYNSSNGNNCVATIRDSTGSTVDMSVRIEVPDTGSSAEDFGRFTSHTGPAYVYGRGHCVNWGGSIGTKYVQIYNSNCGRQERRETYTR